MAGPRGRTTRAKPAETKQATEALARASSETANSASARQISLCATRHCPVESKAKYASTLEQEDAADGVCLATDQENPVVCAKAQLRHSRRRNRDDSVTDPENLKANGETNKSKESATTLSIHQSSVYADDSTQINTGGAKAALPMLPTARTTRSAAMKEKIKAFETTAAEAATASILQTSTTRVQASAAASDHAEQAGKPVTVKRLQQETQNKMQVPMTPSRRAAASARRVECAVRVFEITAREKNKTDAGVGTRLPATHEQSAMTPSLSAAHRARRVTGPATGFSGFGQAVAAGRAVREGGSVKNWVINEKSSFDGLKVPGGEETAATARASSASLDSKSDIPEKQGRCADEQDHSSGNVGHLMLESSIIESRSAKTAVLAVAPEIETDTQSGETAFNAKAKSFMSPLCQSFTVDDSPVPSPTVSPSRLQRNGSPTERGESFGSCVNLQEDRGDATVTVSKSQEVAPETPETPKKNLSSKTRSPSAKKKSEINARVSDLMPLNHSAVAQTTDGTHHAKCGETGQSAQAPVKVYSIALMPSNPNANFTEAAQTPPPATAVTRKRARGDRAVLQACDDIPTSSMKSGRSGKRKRAHVCTEDSDCDDGALFQDASMAVSNGRHLSFGLDSADCSATSDEEGDYDCKEDERAIGGWWMFGFVKGIGRKLGMFG
ncbi:hypothetical protein HDU84_008338 [Entophlyctis sp. JEL0112]|nr:hypothetical protein HDU84_008338 [Entophlyctis sp. JEL0112]